MSFVTSKAKNVITAEAMKRGCPPLAPHSFGKTFGPVMFEVDYSVKAGWQEPTLRDYADITLPSMAGSIHYGLQCFDTITLTRDASDADKLLLFRPKDHIARLQKSATAIAFPEFDQGELLEAVRKVAQHSAAFVPTGPHQRLQIRTMIVGNNKNLSAGAADEVKLVVFASAVDATFRELKTAVNRDVVRAWQGGTGHLQVGANYANQIHFDYLARKDLGVDKLLWLTNEKNTIQQVGELNFFAMMADGEGKREIITPALDGTVTAGVTRDTVLDIAKAVGVPATERPVDIDEIIVGLKENRVLEMFATGNVPVLSRVRSILVDGETYATSEGASLAEAFHQQIVDVQRDASHEWSVVV